MNKYLYIINLFILTLIIYFGIGEFNYLTIIIPLIITLILFFLYEILQPLLRKKRKKNLTELIKKKYEKTSENSNGNMLFEFQNKQIMLEYHCDNIIGTYLHNSIIIYLNISKTEPELLNLCKIHFETKVIDGKIWIVKMFKPFRKKTVKYLVQNSEKEIIEIIEKNCGETGRDDFKFYQAHYSPDEKCITHSEMSLLRFSKEV